MNLLPSIFLHKKLEKLLFQNGKILLVSITGAGIEDCVVLRSGDDWHREILRNTEEEIRGYGIDDARVDELGGAWVKFDEDGNIVIYGISDDFGTQGGDALPTADRDGATSVNLGFMGMGSAQGILTETGQTDVFRMNVIPGTTIGIAAFGSLPLDIQVFDGQGQSLATPGTDGFPGTTQIEVGDATTLFISVGGSDSD